MVCCGDAVGMGMVLVVSRENGVVGFAGCGVQKRRGGDRSLTSLVACLLPCL